MGGGTRTVNSDIIGPSWSSNLPAGYSFTKHGSRNIHEFNIIILCMGKMKKAEFFFCWRNSKIHGAEDSGILEHQDAGRCHENIYTK
jgi:hypothetical protein